MIGNLLLTWYNVLVSVLWQVTWLLGIRVGTLIGHITDLLKKLLTNKKRKYTVSLAINIYVASSLSNQVNPIAYLVLLLEPGDAFARDVLVHLANPDFQV